MFSATCTAAEVKKLQLVCKGKLTETGRGFPETVSNTYSRTTQFLWRLNVYEVTEAAKMAAPEMQVEMDKLFPGGIRHADYAADGLELKAGWRIPGPACSEAHFQRCPCIVDDTKVRCEIRDRSEGGKRKVFLRGLNADSFAVYSGEDVGAAIYERDLELEVDRRSGFAMVSTRDYLRPDPLGKSTLHYSQAASAGTFECEKTPDKPKF